MASSKANGSSKDGKKAKISKLSAKASKPSDLKYVIYSVIIALIAVSLGLTYYQNKDSFLKEVPQGTDHYRDTSFKGSVAEQPVPVDAERVPEEIRPALGVYWEEETHPLKSIRGVPKAGSPDLKNWPPGERGVGVSVDVSKLSDAEKKRKEDMYQNHAFEEYISELISPDRSLPDWRGDFCRENYNPDRSDLDPTSIVICFHNEAWSTLIRTVHSIMNRTPKKLIQEILLIDDLSDMEHLGSKLDEYIERNFGKDGIVKVVRLPERHGLIKCRMHGAEISEGKVLTFLDSHIEAGIGWLEPLLYRVKDEPKLIANPVIDAINDTTFWYTFIQKDIYGLTNWEMTFEWHELSAEKRRKKVDPWAPHDNPVMSGGLFTINKEWFRQLGFYDVGMEIWGGENFEVSFKAWMCGGKIEILPCSRVGHVFRTWSPYTVDVKKVGANNLRVADVWADEFKYLFYDRFGKYDQPLQERIGNFGDTSERKQIRERLQCKSFKWYLTRIAIELPFHELKGAGEIKNPTKDFCLDQNDHTNFDGHPVYTIECHGSGGNQYWWYNKNGYLLRDYQCIGVLGDGRSVVVTSCHQAQRWKYDEATGRLKAAGKCLTVGVVNNIYTSVMEQCDPNNVLQEWRFSKYSSTGLAYEDLGDEKLLKA